MVDVLSRLLHDLRPQAPVLSRGSTAPVPGARLTVLVPVGGPATVRVDGIVEEVEVPAGAAALVVGGLRYAVRSPVEGVVTAVYTGTSGVCERVLAGLPALLTDAGPDTTSVAGLLTTELSVAREGHGILAARLADLLVLTALRGWLDTAADAPAWYRALTDPVVGPAVGLLHTDPAHPWTVEELAARCGLSRAAFARRFTALIGEPPISYLACWRLCVAGDLLRTTNDTVATIARRVGYNNASALSSAFTRARGVRPGTFRGTAQERDSAISATA